MASARGSAPSRSGFTLLELLLAVTILAMIAAIAVPMFGNSIRKASEGSTKGKLSSIRRALAVYYAEREGVYPADLGPLMAPGNKWLKGNVQMYTHSHGNSSSVNIYTSFDAVADGPAYGYVNIEGDSNWGKLWVQCTHLDMRGTAWSSY